MVEAVPSSDLFSRPDRSGRDKVLILGSSSLLPPGALERARSLQSEHVSPAQLMRRGISRPAPRSTKAERAELAAVRRWFWTRKPDAGFLLEDFPATLLQAKVLDEWLEARSEGLDSVLVATDAPAELVIHYRDLGLLEGEPADPLS